jgi:hypothetical protein
MMMSNAFFNTSQLDSAKQQQQSQSSSALSAVGVQSQQQSSQTLGTASNSHFSNYFNSNVTSNFYLFA